MVFEHRQDGKQYAKQPNYIHIETSEESTQFKAEVQRLHLEIERFQSEANGLREELNHSHHNVGMEFIFLQFFLNVYIKTCLQDTNSLVAPVLNQVKKTIRKLGATSSNDDNLEDSMRQVKKYVRHRKNLVCLFFISIVYIIYV